MSDFHTEAETRYQEALDVRDQIRTAWQEAGSPLLSVGSKGQPVEHPFVKMMRDADLLVDRLASALRQRHRGPDPSAVPSITRSPGSRLRAAE